jgi:hypothetical protein
MAKPLKGKLTVLQSLYYAKYLIKKDFKNVSAIEWKSYIIIASGAIIGMIVSAAMMLYEVINI